MTTPCCSQCRTPFSVCALSRQCKCHRIDDAAYEKASEEESARIEGFKPWR